jgi:hypothetical protein
VRTDCIFLKVIVGVPAMLVATSCVAKPDQVKICYTEFGYETVVATTQSSIVEKSCKLIDKSDSDLKKLYSYLQQEPKTIAGQPDFDSLKVRLEVIDEDKAPYFVDDQGVVMISNNRYQVDASVLASMEKLLNRLFGFKD